MHPYLDVLDIAQWRVERQSIADLRRHGRADALLIAVFGDEEAIWVTDRDAVIDRLIRLTTALGVVAVASVAVIVSRISTSTNSSGRAGSRASLPGSCRSLWTG